jgi:hypothetical protein
MFSLIEQKGPTKNGKNFTLWPKLSREHIREWGCIHAYRHPSPMQEPHRRWEKEIAAITRYLREKNN